MRKAVGIALVTAGVLGTPCIAADYPTRPVRVLAGGAAGGPIDLMSRVVFQKLSEQVGQTIVIDNRGGAGGTIATRLAAQATPDGYTLLCNSSQYVVAPSLYKQPGYDPFRDFAPIINAGATPNIIFVQPSFAANNLQDLIALGKKQKLSYGSAGAGSTPHLTSPASVCSNCWQGSKSRTSLTAAPRPRYRPRPEGRCRSASPRCRRRSSSSKAASSVRSR